MVKILKQILLTFDIEELDFLSRGKYVEDIYIKSFEGTERILEILKKYKIKGTFFVTSEFADKYPDLIRKISQENEVALHGYKHSHNYKEMDKKKVIDYLKKAKNHLESITKNKIYGFRAPRLQYPSYKIIKKLGFVYDSSFHPTWIPTRYNNLNGKINIFIKDNLIIVPLSVIPFVKFPLFWFAFRNLGLIYTKIGTFLSLLNQNYINLYLHSWEFVNLSKYKISFLFKRNTGEKMATLLENYIEWCQRKEYKFSTIADYIKNEKG